MSVDGLTGPPAKFIRLDDKSYNAQLAETSTWIMKVTVCPEKRVVVSRLRGKLRKKGKGANRLKGVKGTAYP